MSSPDSQPEIAAYRAEFPVAQTWAYLNHAAVAPISRRAGEAIRAWTDDVLANGAVNEGTWWRRVEAIREAAARLVGAQALEIAFIKNTSEGIALVAEGFPFRPGDNVVIAEGEYPANVYPWMNLHDKQVEVRTVACRGVRIDLADIAAAIDARTRVVSLSHVQFATGFRSDLAVVGQLCRQRGADFCVDAIQGLGVFAIDVEAMQIDYLAADGHKWLVAPEGAGIFFVRQAKVEKLRPASVGWRSVVNMLDYSTIDFRLKPNAGRFEEGSLNMPGILALGGSIDLIAEVGVANVGAAVRAITDYLIDRVRSLGATVVSSRAENEWSGIVSFELPGVDPRQAVQRCKQAKVFISTRAGRLRASPHFYNNREDVDRMIEVLRS